jgi:tetratricopeptide (TPR) repeat protein
MRKRGSLAFGLVAFFLVGAVACSRVTAREKKAASERIVLTKEAGAAGASGNLGTTLQRLAGGLIGDETETQRQNRGDKGVLIRKQQAELAPQRSIGRQAIQAENVRESGPPHDETKERVARATASRAATAECDRAYEDFELARKAKNFEDSIFYYRRGLRLCPNDEIAHNELGEVYLGIRQYEDATNEFRRALEINPESSQARRNLESAKNRR